MRLTDGANPMLHKNGIRENRHHGVSLQSDSAGRMVRNMIERNGAVGVHADAECRPTLWENYVQMNDDEEMVLPAGCDEEEPQIAT